MTVHFAGFIPAAPLLVPPLAGNDLMRDDDLRHAVRQVVDEAARIQLATGATIVTIGRAPETGPYAGTWDFSRLGLPVRGGVAAALPTSLGIAAWFLDEADRDGERLYFGVADSATPQECAALGARLTGDLVLLVVGDGSARRDAKAPGSLDPRATAFDAAAAAALGSGDPEALLALDAETGRQLLADGRAPWQVAAGATHGRPWRATVLAEDARYGVGYVIGRWLPHLDSNQEPLD